MDSHGKSLQALKGRLSLEMLSSLMFIALCAVGIWVLLFGRPGAAAPVQAASRSPRLQPPEPLPLEPVSIDGAASKGTEDAPVVLIEYSDFQCPFCGKFARETLPALEQQYVNPGKVLLVFRHLPLNQIHPYAQKAAEAAACAGRQGKFWPMHEQLFEDQAHLDDASLKRRARTLGLNSVRFATCLGGGEVTEEVHRDSANGSQLQISGTPTFLVGTKTTDGRVKVVQRLSGALPLGQFQAAFVRVLGASN